MATKIIKPGTDTYRTTCLECGAVFTYERGDVHHNFAHYSDNVACPHCGTSCRHFGVATRVATSHTS